MQIDTTNKPIVAQALALATKHHEGVTRKYCGEPYINHPIRVCETMLRNGYYEELPLAVALLHDCLEDPNANGVMLNPWHVEVIHPRLPLLIGFVTKPTGGNRASRNERFNAQLFKAPLSIKSVKCADIADNLKGLVDNDPGFAKIYLDEKEEQLKALKIDSDRRHGLVFSNAWAALQYERNQLGKHLITLGLKEEANRKEEWETALAEVEAMEREPLVEMAQF